MVLISTVHSRYLVCGAPGVMSSDVRYSDSVQIPNIADSKEINIQAGSGWGQPAADS